MPTKEEEAAGGGHGVLRKAFRRRGPSQVQPHLFGAPAAVSIWTPTPQAWPLAGLSAGLPWSMYPLSRALGAGQGVRRRGSF